MKRSSRRRPGVARRTVIVSTLLTLVVVGLLITGT
jgi:hypothetical protein